jgi:hypothetical protein
MCTTSPSSLFLVWHPQGGTAARAVVRARPGPLVQQPSEGGNVRLFANVFNVLNSVYIQDAVENSRDNSFDGDHDADDAEVFLGLPRTFNLGFEVGF